jgi:DNA polymerase IV
MSAFCRDCLSDVAQGARRCASCKGRRIVDHPELDALSIAHLDCDAFYASIEKRDDPVLRDKPVIVGGRKRGVVMTACYLARISGVKSAMPMFQARTLCPEAIVVKPRMAKYAEVAKTVRELMRELTPLVEPLSLDEAFLDLSGTERLHRLTPAKSMARLARRIEDEIGVTVSIGLSFNKFLAKLASEADKPRGFAVIGRNDAKAILHDKPIGVLRGVGAALQARLARDGLRTIAQLQTAGAHALDAKYGTTGKWLWHLANADDDRPVNPAGDRKTISSETTFEHDISSFRELEAILWRQAERVSAHAKSARLGGRTVVLKLKTANFRIRTRSASLEVPTQLADTIFRVARNALRREADGPKFRLLGVGLSNLADATRCDQSDLVDRSDGKRAKAERAMDRLRSRFGNDAVEKGRSLAGGAIGRQLVEPGKGGAKREVRVDQRHRRDDTV